MKATREEGAHGRNPTTPTKHPYLDHAVQTQIQRKNLLDVFRLTAGYIGVYRETFDRVTELDGFELTPVGDTSDTWEFRNPMTGQRGRLLDVDGHLSDDPIAINTRGRAYMITRQDFTLALLFPGNPQRIRLNESRYKVLHPEASRRPLFPPEWPEGLVAKVIRMRLRKILILEEIFLLKQIGLRGNI